MLISYKHNFVFFSLPKTGTTSVEKALKKHTDIDLSFTPAMKHTTAWRYERFLEPFFDKKLDKVGVVREPTEWLFSWYKYLTREEISDPQHHGHHLYSGRLTFDEFTTDYLLPVEKRQSCTKFLGSPSRFYKSADGGNKMDYLFRFDELDKLISFFQERVGESINLVKHNISPNINLNLSPETHEKLKSYFENDYSLYYNNTM